MYDVKPVTSQKPYDCGPTCLKMLLDYYGIDVPLEQLTRECAPTMVGTSAKTIMEVGRAHGLDMQSYSMDAAELVRQDRPGIVFWKFQHFVVFCGRDEDGRVSVCNPDLGRYRMSEATFATYATGIDKHPGQVVAIFAGEPITLGSETNIAAGRLFTHEGRLYRAIVAIVRGEQVIEGVNATLISVAEVINELETKE